MVRVAAEPTAGHLALQRLIGGRPYGGPVGPIVLGTPYVIGRLEKTAEAHERSELASGQENEPRKLEMSIPASASFISRSQVLLEVCREDRGGLEARISTTGHRVRGNQPVSGNTSSE